jgi:hypothetical protein
MVSTIIVTGLGLLGTTAWTIGGGAVSGLAGIGGPP